MSSLPPGASALSPNPPPLPAVGSRRHEEPSEFRSHLLSVLPSVCGVISPLAGIVSDYVEGEKFPVFSSLPEDYQSNGKDIFEACQTNDLNQLRFLIEQQNVDPNSRSRVDFLHSRPIIAAAASNSLPCVQYLLFRGVSPFTKSNHQTTAFQLAAARGHHIIADYFLTYFNNAPAPPSVPGQEAANEPIPSRLCLVTDGNRATVLHSAAASGCLPIIERLIHEFGLDPNDSTNIFKETPLHYAASWGKMDAVRMLTEDFQADIRKVNRDGRTAAEVAEEEGHLNVAAYLKAKGAV